jgi:hypothetical protein
MTDATLGAGEYLLGTVELLVMLGGLAVAAVSIRRAAVPGFSGVPALVGDVVAGLSLAVLLSVALGTFGAFSSAGIAIGSVALGVLVPLATSRVAAHPKADTPPAPPGHRLGLPLVALIVAAVVTAWASVAISGITSGMSRADSLWYHMPLSLRFVETGSTGEIFFFDPIFLASFYPANSEIFHAIPLLAYGRDFLSPLLNFGFLGLALISGWAVGRPYGLAPHALIGAAVVLGAETMYDFQAGESLNDICGVAFLLAAVALLVNGHASRSDGRSVSLGAVALAGAAAGLAAGTKLSFLAPVAFLTVAVVALAPRGVRLRRAAAWSVPMALSGGYWYLRNLIAVGNPVPYTGWGPLGLPTPERTLELRPGYSVAHYWDEPQVWFDWFAPSLADELGSLWFVVLLGVVAVGVLALRRGTPVLRALGAVALLTALAYLVTPLTAGGEEGEPIAFEWNIRYLAPAIAIGFAVLPLLPPFASTAQRRSATLVGLGLLALVTIFEPTQAGISQHLKGAIAAGVAVLVAFAASGWAIRRRLAGPRAPRWRNAAVALGLVAAAVAAGFALQRHYFEGRYESLSPELKISGAVRWANEAQNERIAVSGIRGVFNQYAFAGPDLSNHVQWLGIEGADKTYERIPDCATWREEVNAGDFTYVVTLYDPYAPGGLTDTKEALWTREDPGSTQVFRDGPVSVFRIESELDPAACGELPALTPAERSGESVNNQPLANQPPPGASAEGDSY